MNRPVHDVTGYAPADAGYLLCPDCHQEATNDLHAASACDCGPVFLGTETTYTEACDRCGAEIETYVLGE